MWRGLLSQVASLQHQRERADGGGGGPYECKGVWEGFQEAQEFCGDQGDSVIPQDLSLALALVPVLLQLLPPLAFARHGSGSCFQPLAHDAACIWSTLPVCTDGACLPGPAFLSEGVPVW